MHSRIRVLFAIGSMAGGGAERQVLEYLRHLNRSRFQPLLYLISREGEHLDSVPSDVPMFAFSDRFCLLRWNYPGRIHQMQVRDLARVLKNQHVDVLSAVTFQLALVSQGSVRRRPTPTVAIEMCDPRLDFARGARRFTRIKKWLVSRAYRRIHLPVAVSDGVRQATAEYYRVPTERIRTIYNFVDLEALDRLAAQSDVHLDSGKFHIVTVGRLHEQKGHIYLLNAIHRLVNRLDYKNIRLHILGQGPLESEFKQFVHEHELCRNVHFAGFVRNPYAYLKQSQLFCLPSLYEGLPIALLEALALRAPAIAADCPSGPREVLCDGKFGRLVPPGDVSALADGIQHAMTHYDKWRDLVDAARHHVEDTFSVQANMPRLEHILTAVARNKTSELP